MTCDAIPPILEKLEKQTARRLSPFLKWAGGKSQLLQTFDRYIPTKFGAYYEPFLGGGAVFLHLASKEKITRAMLSDLNKDLINCYVVVRDRLEELLRRLAELQTHARDKEYYYRVARRDFNRIELETGMEGDVEKAALLFYLNKTCYNGLYRVNQRGEFNVPWGRYRNPAIFDEGNLRAVQAVLKRPGTTILCDDYNRATKSAVANDFIYFDPPYQPVSHTANFTSYTPQSFEWRDQERLADTYRQLAARGCLLMLSNSPKVEKLYSRSGYRIERVRATRAISCVGSKRGPVEELLILNY
jgi:DNA adenine methylase